MSTDLKQKLEKLQSLIPSITTKKQYLDLRAELRSGAILFSKVPKQQDSYTEDQAEELEDWYDIISDISQAFSNNIKVFLVLESSAEEALISVFPQTSNSPSFSISYCHLPDTEHLSLTSPYQLYETVKRTFNYYDKEFELDKEQQLKKIHDLVSQFPVVIFIKGSPFQPYCKFSKSFVALLNEYKLNFRSFDIFQDLKVRGFMKFYSDWRTFPQIFIHGKLLGGLDHLKELHEKGQLKDKIPLECSYEFSVKEVKEILKRKKCVIFVKGLLDSSSTENQEILKKMKEFKEDEIIVWDILKTLNYSTVLAEEFKVDSFPCIFIEGKLAI